MAGRRGLVVMVGVAVVAALVVVGWGIDVGGRGGVTVTDEHTSKRGVSVSVKAPEQSAVVSSPLEVRGRAPGSWSFEADFPVEILDADRRSVAEGFATMQGEWMTEDNVDFVGEVEFAPPTSATGFVVLHKANPSGLEKNDDAVEIPVRFEP
jgi:hypothetical protein